MSFSLPHGFSAALPFASRWLNRTGQKGLKDMGALPDLYEASVAELQVFTSYLLNSLGT